MPRATPEVPQGPSQCPEAGPALFTVGHSTQPIGALVAALQANHVDLLVDVRTIPRSRHNPQFNRDALALSLPAANIDYRHEPALGGLRRPRPGSTNSAWRNPSFRGYADYMQTPEFNEALDVVLAQGRERRVALMCAEGNPFRCHRSLIADAIAARGLASCEITPSGQAKPHRMTSFAHIEGQSLTYPGSEEPSVCPGAP